MEEMNVLQIGEEIGGEISGTNFVEVFEALDLSDFKLKKHFSLKISASQSVRGFVTNGRLFLPPDVLASHVAQLKLFFEEAAISMPLFNGIACVLTDFAADDYISHLGHFSIFLDEMKQVISEITVHSKQRLLKRQFTIRHRHLPRGKTLDFLALDAAFILGAAQKKWRAEYIPSLVVEVKPLFALSRNQLVAKYAMCNHVGTFPLFNLAYEGHFLYRGITRGPHNKNLIEHGQQQESFFCSLLRKEGSVVGHCIY